MKKKYLRYMFKIIYIKEKSATFLLLYRYNSLQVIFFETILSILFYSNQ
jgi:hypothetical protein